MASAVHVTASATNREGLSAVQQLGFWSSIASAVTSAGFGVGIVITLVAFKQQTWTGDIVAYAWGYDPIQMAMTVVPSILLAPSFLGLVAATHELAPSEHRIWTVLAGMFAVLYAGVVGVNYFLQLTVVRQNLSTGVTEGMSLFAMGNPVSVFWELEILGYFCQGVAAALLAIVFTGERIATWLRWMLIAVFVTAAIGVVAAIKGISFTDPVFAVGSGAWTVVFPVTMVLSAVYFRRQPARCIR
jgi:hypothetical protein